MSKIGVLEVLGYRFHYAYDRGDYRVFDSPQPFEGFEPTLEGFEAKAIAQITEQIAQDPFVMERFITARPVTLWH